MTKPELLAPAGNMDALYAAVRAGADAVYLGGTLFSARAGAGNFDLKQLREALDYCHLRRVRVYAAVNTLIAAREFPELDRFIRAVSAMGVDAVIVQDLGAAAYMRSIAPALPLHASTQMTVCDLEGALFLKEHGFKRVVLARELSAEQIADICQNSGLEIEVFVHGALCVCYSGQCLMSSMIGGRSGNRGKCAQPCRLAYSMGGKHGFLLSPKDLSMLQHVDALRQLGVASLKIEGRMKGPEYVGTVTSVYRKCIDDPAAADERDRGALERVFYRGGFTDGYFTGRKGAGMFCHDKPDNPYARQETPYPINDRTKQTALHFQLRARAGEPLSLTAADEYGHRADYIAEEPLERAQKAAASAERLRGQLQKLGGTVFYAAQTEIQTDGRCYVPVSAVNNARRAVTAQLEEQIVSGFRRTAAGRPPVLHQTAGSSPMALSVMVSTAEQLEAMRKTGCRRMLVPYGLPLLPEDIAVLPRISPPGFKQRLADLPARHVLVRNLGQLFLAKQCGKAIHTDFTLNCYNVFTAGLLAAYGAQTVTVSAECTCAQIRAMGGIAPLEAVIYGRLPLMLTENCIKKAAVGCKQAEQLQDRTGAQFPVRCLEGCRNEILNCRPIVMSDKLDDLQRAGLQWGRLLFTDETPAQCEAVYRAYQSGTALEPPFTRGKFYKGV